MSRGVSKDIKAGGCKICHFSLKKKRPKLNSTYLNSLTLTTNEKLSKFLRCFSWNVSVLVMIILWSKNPTVKYFNCAGTTTR